MVFIKWLPLTVTNVFEEEWGAAQSPLMDTSPPVLPFEAAFSRARPR